MNKFKGFFTFISFFWLWCCGFLAIYQWFATGEFAWCGLLINSWALPLWMLLRFRNPRKYSGDQRETPAFAAVLIGLAITLLVDTDKGPPLYLAMANLFVVLVYLFHLSALRQPALPAVDSRFPALDTAGGGRWDAAEFCRRENAGGVLLVFLRGSFCADSRAQLMQLAAEAESLSRYRVRPVLISTEAADHWLRLWSGGTVPDFVQLWGGDNRNQRFVAADGAPFWLRLAGWLLRSRGDRAGACRPGCWLLDSEGLVIWRHLPENYRLPGSGEFIRGQLVRLEE